MPRWCTTRRIRSGTKRSPSSGSQASRCAACRRTRARSDGAAIRTFGFGLVGAVLSLSAFLLIPPANVGRNSLIVPDAADEWNYLAHATAIAYGRFDYALETADWFPPNHAFGPSILASPVVAAFTVLDRISGNPVVRARTYKTLYKSWTGLSFGVATHLYLVAGCFFLYLTLKNGFKTRDPAGITVIAVLGSGLLFYAYRRAVSSHVYEFAALSAALYLLYCNPSFGRSKPRPLLKWLVTGAVAILIYLIRYNDLALAAAFLWASLALRFSPGSAWRWVRLPRARWTAAALFLAVALAVAVTAKVSLAHGTRSDGLWNVAELRLKLAPHAPPYYIGRLWHVFFGPDWALVVTAPLVLVGLALWTRPSDRRYLAAPFFAALACNFAMTVAWGTQGSGFGYRYFVPAALPLATLRLGAWIDAGEGRVRFWWCAAAAAVPAYLLFVFESCEALTLAYGVTRWGRGWVNNDFLIRAFEMTAFEPGKLWGFVYPRTGLSLLGHWFGEYDMKWAGIDKIATVKLLGLYALPSLAACALARFFDRTTK